MMEGAKGAPAGVGISALAARIGANAWNAGSLRSSNPVGAWMPMTRRERPFTRTMRPTSMSGLRVDDSSVASA